MFPQDKLKHVSSLCFSALQSCHHKVAASSPKTRIIGASALFLAAFTIGAAGFAPAEPDLRDAPVNPISKELALPNLQQQISALEERSQYYVNEEKVRSGDTITYSELAKRLDKPRAVRAVASACAANPLAMAVPCHRVLRSDGGISGYRWGVERKKQLLQLEHQHNSKASDARPA